jgi:hypothetical protein
VTPFHSLWLSIGFQIDTPSRIDESLKPLELKEK